MSSWSHYREGRRVVIIDQANRTTPTVIGFFSQNTVFSNHFPIDMVYDGKLFKTSEHLYFYLRAIEFGDMLTAEAFRTAANGKVVKTMAKQRPLRSFDQKVWHGIRIHKMAIALVTKFSQNSDLRRILCNTRPCSLVEMSKHDPFWGCARDVEQIVLDGKLGVGLNVLGRLLSNLREMFMDDELEQKMIESCRAYAHKTDREVYSGLLVLRTFPEDQLRNIINGKDSISVTPPKGEVVHNTLYVTPPTRPIIRAEKRVTPSGSVNIVSSLPPPKQKPQLSSKSNQDRPKSQKLLGVTPPTGEVVNSLLHVTPPTSPIIRAEKRVTLPGPEICSSLPIQQQSLSATPRNSNTFQKQRVWFKSKSRTPEKRSSVDVGNLGAKKSRDRSPRAHEISQRFDETVIIQDENESSVLDGERKKGEISDNIGKKLRDSTYGPRYVVSQIGEIPGMAVCVLYEWPILNQLYPETVSTNCQFQGKLLGRGDSVWFRGSDLVDLLRGSTKKYIHNKTKVNAFAHAEAPMDHEAVPLHIVSGIIVDYSRAGDARATGSLGKATVEASGLAIPQRLGPDQIDGVDPDEFRIGDIVEAYVFNLICNSRASQSYWLPPGFPTTENASGEFIPGKAGATYIS